MSQNELLPCPFCGPGASIVSLWHDDVAHRWRVGCGRCGCSTGIHPRDKTEAPAITAWNTRIEAAQAVAPGGGEVAIVRVGTEPWNCGLAVADLEVPLPAGTKLYTAAAPASEAVRSEMDAHHHYTEADAVTYIRDWCPDHVKDYIDKLGKTNASEGKGPPIAEMEYEFRICEHCGCNTNASLRRCCDKGTNDDRTSLPAHPIDKAYSIRLRNEMAAASSAAGECPFYSGGECTCGNDQHPWISSAHGEPEQEQAGEDGGVHGLAAKAGVRYAADECCELGVAFYAFTESELDKFAAALLRRAARVEVTDAMRSWHKAFKNFHRNLCKRFGYCHDEIDWSRDQVSLEEHIASKLALAEQDARRYRWLRENALSVCWQSGRWNSGWTDYHPASSEHFDTAIDAAIAAGEGK